MRQQRSLNALIAIATLVCLAPLVVLALSTDALAERVVTRELRRDVETTATVSAALVAEQLRGLNDLVESYASRPSLRALVAGGPQGANVSALNTLVAPLLDARPGIRGLFITDIRGTLTHALPETPGLVGQDFSFRDWYKGVTRSNGAYISEAYETALIGNPRVVAVATYILGEDSRPVAILAAVHGLDAIDATADRMAEAQGVQLTVTDQRGVVVAAPGPPSTKSLNPVRDRLEVRRALRGQGGVLRTETSTGASFVAYAPVPALGWAVTAERPTATVLAPVRDLRASVWTLSILVGAAILIGVGMLARALRRGREMELDLQAEEARTRGIVEAANDAFIGMDTDGRITNWNPAAEALFGWGEREALGRSLSELVIPEQYRAAHEAGLRRYLETGEGPVLGKRIEITGLRSTGDEVPVELSIFATEVGEVTRFNAFVQDITARRNEAEALAAARDQAMEASRLKSDFLANMSHEIRTPMNGVLGMTSLLLDSPLSREQRAFAESVMASGEALLSILNDILDFSKMEAGKLDIETIDFGLRDLIESTVELLAPRAHEKGLEVAALVEPALPDVLRGDPGRVRQVLTNLVGNAIKFTPGGEVVVRANVVEETETGLVVRVEVTDTGIGIGEEARSRLFEAFAQADSSTTREFGGTGLGLAISKQLVELMGGRIGVESTLGAGSTFWFELPFVNAGERRQTRRVPRADLRGLRVLVVDDNATNREVIKQFLKSWSMEGVECAGGRDAIEAMRRAAAAGTPFDLAVVDLNMPGMDGLEVGRRVATERDLAATRLVLLTSSAQRGEAADAERSGFAGYLTKPVRQSHLLDTLANVMGEHDGAHDEEHDEKILTRHMLPESQRPRVLVVEDNEVSQRVAVGMLQRIGYRTDVASNGVEALEAIARGGYAAVLMDCQMPVMDGYEAAREVRRRETAGSHVPIIALSASAMEGDAEEAMATGMDEYLTKPIARPDLERTLARWAPLPEASPPDETQPSHRAGTSASVLDPEKIAELEAVGGPDFVSQLLGLFVDSAPERLDDFRSALAAADVEGAARAAHTLRGGAANVGATDLAAACEEAESSARSGDLERAAAAAERAASLLPMVVQAREERRR